MRAVGRKIGELSIRDGVNDVSPESSDKAEFRMYLLDNRRDMTARPVRGLSAYSLAQRDPSPS